MIHTNTGGPASDGNGKRTIESIPVFTVGKGRTAIRARLLYMHKDLIVAVSGGEEHIGASAMGEPYPSRVDPEKSGATVSLITRTGHKEDEIVRKYAHNLTAASGRPVMVCGGIHLEEITPEEILEIEKNAEELLSILVAENLLSNC